MLNYSSWCYDTSFLNSSDNAGCFHISFSFTDVGIRIPTGASALGMTHRNDSRSGYRPLLSLRASAHTGVAIRSPTIILQITLLVSVNRRRLYCKIYIFCWPCYDGSNHKKEDTANDRSRTPMGSAPTDPNRRPG